MWGGRRTPAASASFRKRSQKTWLERRWRWRILTATGRSKTSSTACQTPVIPPAPISLSSRYRPASLTSIIASVYRRPGGRSLERDAPTGHAPGQREQDEGSCRSHQGQGDHVVDGRPDREPARGDPRRRRGVGQQVDLDV